MVFLLGYVWFGPRWDGWCRHLEGSGRLPGVGLRLESRRGGAQVGLGGRAKCLETAFGIHDIKRRDFSRIGNESSRRTGRGAIRNYKVARKESPGRGFRSLSLPATRCKGQKAQKVLLGLNWQAGRPRGWDGYEGSEAEGMRGCCRHAAICGYARLRKWRLPPAPNVFDRAGVAHAAGAVFAVFLGADICCMA